ncbi:alpha/beta hydrolase [Roseobacter litoralis]|uniref:alpha/beta hydrolase n=1 Tax=Roseobacter litoralis TaxID=42443 RepID=UPI0024941870|nr:alpha/beta hydrolase [Roseobacter litoralis]
MLQEWTGALLEGAWAAGVELPADLEIVLPFYGDALDEVVREFELPLTSEITTRGDAFQDEFLLFQEEIVSEIRASQGITDQQIDEIYGNNPRERAPWNWEWVQAIIKAIDRHTPSVSQGFLETFMRDVFIYLQSSGARSIIDGIVMERLDARPTIVVAHSLGTVVMYNILRNTSALNTPLFVTLGSPLGIRAIQRRFRPLRYPANVGPWINAFDERDVVALNPLDQQSFPVMPQIANINNIDNQTDNRHGIVGYLDKSEVALPILDAL